MERGEGRALAGDGVFSRFVLFTGLRRRRLRGEGEGIIVFVDKAAWFIDRGLRLTRGVIVGVVDGDVSNLNWFSLLPNVDGALGVMGDIVLSSMEESSDSDESDRLRLVGLDDVPAMIAMRVEDVIIFSFATFWQTTSFGARSARL